MHELAIAESIVETCLPIARQAGARKILEIRMSIGVLSGVILPSLEEALLHLTKGTIAEGAVLVVRTLPIRVRCRSCGAESEIERRTFVCPRCGSEELRITGGREYYVDDLKVE